ncbi:MAG: caspase family protein, partial [Actinomycetota bacterium]|nr:caspase family protein [Actinomycetota bacterium]
MLIGVSQFQDGELPALPAVDNNVAGMKSVLVDPHGVGLSSEHCRDAVNESDSNVLAQYLDAAAKEAEDMLFVYYAGHGLIHEDDLVLSLPTTDRRRPWGHGLRMTDIRKLVARSRAANRILVLDCCFSGRAVDLMSSLEATVTGQVRIDGTVTLTSTPPNGTASAPIGAAYTAFTGELLSFLRNGDPSQPELLTIRCVYDHLKIKLASRGLPSPQLLGSGNTFDLALTRNPAIVGRSTALHTTGSEQPGPVESLTVESFRFDAVRLVRAVVDEALRTADFRTSTDMMELAHELTQRVDSVLVRVSGADTQAETSEAIGRLFEVFRADPGRRLRCRVAYSVSSEADAARMIARARPMSGNAREWAEFQNRVELVADHQLDVDTYALLHNNIGPLDAMRWWQEQLDQSYKSRSSPHDMILRLAAAARELIDLRRTYKVDQAAGTGFRFWQRDDRQPDTIERGEVIVARSRVSWRELR